MTRDEKLAVIAGNLRDCRSGGKRITDFVNGNLYALALIAEEQNVSERILDAASLVLPADDMRMLAAFCRIYYSYFGDSTEYFGHTDYSEKSNAVAIPEIPRLDEAIDILGLYGIKLDREYGDTFASCAEDVEFGNSGYVLLPYSDPTEGRLRTFDKMRSRCGLKIHTVIYIPDDSGGEYAYQLCGLGIAENISGSGARLSFSAETDSDPMDYLHAVEEFSAEILFADIEKSGDTAKIRAVLNTENTDERALGGMLLYLNSAADLTIDGVYAEIHHKSKGL